MGPSYSCCSPLPLPRFGRKARVTFGLPGSRQIVSTILLASKTPSLEALPGPKPDPQRSGGRRRGPMGLGAAAPGRRSRYPRFFPWKTEEKSGNGEKSDISKGKEKLNGKSLFLYMYFFLPSRLRFGAALGVGGGSAEPPAAFTPAGRGRAVCPPLPKSPPPSRNTLPPSPWAPALLEAGGRGAICGVGAGRSRP